MVVRRCGREVWNPAIGGSIYSFVTNDPRDGNLSMSMKKNLSRARGTMFEVYIMGCAGCLGATQNLR